MAEGEAPELLFSDISLKPVGRARAESTSPEFSSSLGSLGHPLFILDPPMATYLSVLLTRAFFLHPHGCTAWAAPTVSTGKCLETYWVGG